jgi:DNA replication protein DnaC
MKTLKDELDTIVQSMLPISRPEKEMQQHNSSPESRRAANLRDSGIEAALLPDDVRAVVKDLLRATQALEAVRKWYAARYTGLRGAGSMMLLLGPCSRGKTVAEAWLLAQLGGRYVTAERLRLLKMARDGGASFYKLVEDTKVLALDDVGVELDLPSAEVALHEFFQARMGMQNGWSIISSNLSLRGFVERFGERIEHRLTPGYAVHVVSVDGPNLRQRSR